MARPLASASTNGARLAELSDKLEGYPTRGVHIGGGRHVNMPATWDGTGAVPPGWSSYRAAIDVANDVGQLEYIGANGDTWLRANGAAPTLTSAERTELITLLTPARRFSSRWPARFW